MEQLDKLSHDVDELKKNYEQYFQGIQRIPPERDFTRVQHTIRRIKEEFITNTGIKFRLASLVSKFQSYSRYWSRIMREIEEGRYHRDCFKADMRVGSMTTPGIVKAKDPHEDDDHLTALHKEYMMARLECDQGVAGLSKEKIKQSIEKSLPQLKKRYPGKKIEFKVVVEKGKAKLKAVPR